jgi:hypothetical protein
LSDVTFEETNEDEVPSSEPITIQIWNLDKEEWPLKKIKKQILVDGVNYDKTSPYALIPFPQRLKEQRDEEQSSTFIDILKSLMEDEYLDVVEMEEWSGLIEEEGQLVDLFEPLVVNNPMKNDFDFDQERVAIERVTFNIFVTNEPLVEKQPCMTEEVVDLSNEDDFKDNIIEFEESKKVKECIANLEVWPIFLCEHSKSFFEDSANYILEP